MNASNADDRVPYIAYEEFRTGLPHARFRVVVNPELARPYIVRRTRVNAIAFSLICLGAALALAGQGIAGVVLVGCGIGANRLVRYQAGRIVLHLAHKDASVYSEVTTSGVMEVRRAG